MSGAMEWRGGLSLPAAWLILNSKDVKCDLQNVKQS